MSFTKLNTSNLNLEAPPGTIQKLTIDTEDYALVHHKEGWSILPDRCTHSACSFTRQGEIADGTVLICNCHGSEFDVVSGKVLQGPAEQDLAVTSVIVNNGTLNLESSPEECSAPSGESASTDQTFTLSVNISKCKGYANCVVAADDFLDLDDDGLVVILQDQVEESHRSRIEAAVRSCPVSALRLERN